jgi:WD40 repeat protein
MSGDRFDYRSERQRHEKFVGRAGLLARLDRLLVDSETDRWVVITGGPGMGKSALLAAWLARREAAGAVVPHHFIRRGAYDWDDPAKLVGSLVAQIEDHFSDLREPDADERMHPATRLARVLSRVSENVLRPRGECLVVLIDGLDEYDPPVGSSVGDPLAAFLPDALPSGARLLCASRPRHPYVSNLEARDGKLVQIDLDDPDNAADNNATVRAFWERAAEPLGLDAGFVDEAVARAGGNVQHAVQLQKHLDVIPPEKRHVEEIPRGLAALIEKSWMRIAVDAVVVEGLGILCAAHEALTLDELSAIASWTSEVQRRTFERAAKELLVETLRPEGEPEYRLHHDSIRGHIARAIGKGAVRSHHAALARRHANWSAPSQAAVRRYALRHALIHRAEAGDWAAAWQLASDMSFLEAKCRELGAHETEIDIVRVAERCRASDDAVLFRRFSDLGRALGRESHWLRVMPEAIAPLMWNRLRRLDWSANDLDGQLQVPVKLSFLRVRHVVTRESPALIRNLVGHSAGVTACAVTPDGRRVVSASEDKTLKVWDLETGRTLATLEGHTGKVSACAVTSDSRRVVSASLDRTLKIWDLESGRVLATLEGHTGPVTGCAVTADGQRLVSACRDGTLKVWDLESRSVLATLVVDIHTAKRTVTADGRIIWESETGRSEYGNIEIERRLLASGGGFAGSNMACAVTPDGRRAVSTSKDKTLKIWDLESGCVIATLQGHTGSVLDCTVTPDGQRVISASDDGTLNVWDLESGRALSTLGGQLGWVCACAVTSDGQRVVSASWNRLLVVWDLKSGRALTALEGHAHWLWGCAVTPDGRRAVSASNDQTLKIWDIDGKHAPASSDGHFSRVTACTLTADGRRLISASIDHTLKVWDPESGCAITTLVDRTGALTACAVTPDGQRAISSSGVRTLKVWDLESGRVLTTLEGHTGGVDACAVTADGQHVISASNDRTLRVWDLQSGRMLSTLEGHTGGVEGCAVTPDGRRVISASQDRTLRVWDFESGRVLAILESHKGKVSDCAVTPDGQRVVSASWDQTLKVWDVETGRMLATLQGHDSWVDACAVTADGRHVVSASHDRTLKIWDLETYACLITHRGDAPYAAVAASAAVIVAGDDAGGMWFLDWPSSLRRVKPRRARGSNGGQHGSRVAHAARSPRPQMKKHTILFLAANPLGTDRLALDQEARAILAELERSGHRDQFELVTRWAAQPLDLLRELRKLKPTVVHFSGHGGHSEPGKPSTGEAPSRSVVGEPGSPDSEVQHGLFFQGPDGRPQLVSTAALEETFGAAGSSVKLIVLNACYSEAQAEALLAHVDCVVGMGGSIGDDAARNFAVGFYGGLGERESVAAAYKQGRAAISLEGLRDSDRPQLKVRGDVVASQLILAVDPP